MKQQKLFSLTNILLSGSVLLLAVSFYSSKNVYLRIFSVLFTVCVIFGNKLFELLLRLKFGKKAGIIMYLKELRDKSKSINQSQLFLAKYLFDLEVREDEDELTSFTEVKNYLGEKWPFMIPVSNTREKLVSVRGKNVKCISSYAYLDLCRDERVQEEAIKAARAYSTGNHGPRMLCGNLEILEKLETKIAAFFKRESALVFSSGYLACMSAVAGYVRKGDFLLMDKLTHASLKAGAKVSGATPVYFKHNDFVDAENKIKKYKKENQRLIIVIEGVYSMDGDIGNLPVARALVDKYKGFLILDEAHSLGAIGKTGRGTEEYFNYSTKADLICGTFTKSISSVGGFISCSKELREFYTFYGPGVVFSAPLSAYHAGAADKSFEIITNEPHIVTKLQENADYFREKFIKNGFDIGDSVTCILPVIFKDTTKCLKMHDYFLQKGVFTSLVMAPACPVTAPRFRITCTSSMNKTDMDEIVQIFIEARDACEDSEKVKEILEFF
jgi:7-keto-8-aminopelargonate synthetase-like enzyme